ncbi:hypothetical protein [Aurantimonas sp. 22II-16-19i]|uniref:hypothetical protein n=1 Tax=Aurantimonas sp. 22II-16-19i TaxID=1317114 RepID=UPI0009F7C0EB|nr:hypothetical protein [Aurantimonas sp. 22II-16-19i]ORE93249.1 hypothetical protein ATO4_15900 [Aurantimonas sp. 22II-16-19i]
MVSSADISDPYLRDPTPIGAETLADSHFNRTYEEFGLFAKAFSDLFERLHEYKDELKSLITDRFHFIGNAENRIPSA